AGRRGTVRFAAVHPAAVHPAAGRRGTVRSAAVHPAAVHLVVAGRGTVRPGTDPLAGPDRRRLAAGRTAARRRRRAVPRRVPRQGPVGRRERLAAGPQRAVVRGWPLAAQSGGNGCAQSTAVHPSSATDPESWGPGTSLLG